MRRVGDRFVIEAPLDSGGMGSIFRGRDERLGHEVAIKILKPTGDAVLRERFRREALSLAKLRHPGIVAVLDFGEADGDLYTVLELVRGETLKRVIERDGGMPVARAAPIVDQLLEAIAICHDAGIVHRDVKPANVMLSGDRVKLLDFGLARVPTPASEKLTETGAVQGTPHYMAPEQCRGEEVGPEGDVYSAGVVLYEMLAGKEPFAAGDAATLMAAHLFVEPPPLRDVSAGIAAAVHAALAKQPQDRPTARELRAAFAAAVAGTDPEARAEALAALRRDTAGLERSERALPEARGHDRDARGSVVLWMGQGERSAALAACLATAGHACAISDAIPGGDAVVVVSARDGMDRVRAARAKKLAVVVVDVTGPDQTTEVIRAGASDMLLRAAPDADLAPKIARLLRRRRT